jgi:hypothetical protein
MGSVSENILEAMGQIVMYPHFDRETKFQRAKSLSGANYSASY